MSKPLASKTVPARPDGDPPPTRDIGQPGFNALGLLRGLRQNRRRPAGAGADAGGTARGDAATGANADLILTRPAFFDETLPAIHAMPGRAASRALPSRAGIDQGARPAPPPAPTVRVSAHKAAEGPWRVLVAAGILQSPGGHRIDLGPGELTVLRLLSAAADHSVSREALHEALKLPEPDARQSLDAAMYRLRRRIERGVPGVAPLQDRHRCGYQFNAPLRLA